MKMKRLLILTVFVIATVASSYAQKASDFRTAAEKGDAEAQFYLGACYANGLGVPQDDKQAVDWYRKAAIQGHAKAQFNLGVRYMEGKGVPQDDKQAADWFRKAALQGNAEAQNNLGVFYENGRGGLSQDDKQAVDWFRKAAIQGYARAQYNLGWYYKNGRGVAKDEKQAVDWYRKAAIQGYARAQGRLGIHYYSGEGVTENKNYALYWFQKAMEKKEDLGDKGIDILIANTLYESYIKELKEKGYTAQKPPSDGSSSTSSNSTRSSSTSSNSTNNSSTKISKNSSLSELRAAANSGDADAQLNLGFHYSDANGAIKDYKQAFSWFLKSAKQNNVVAQGMVGTYYEHGFGVSQNYKQAIYWYQKVVGNNKNHPFNENINELKAKIASNEPSGEIENIWVDHNVIQNNQKGMLIHVKFSIENMQNKQGYCNAYFHFDNGNKLMDNNGYYNTTDGQVSVGRYFTPPYASATYSDFELFLPYSELHMARGSYNLKFDVALFHNRKQLTISDYVSFTYSR